MIRHAFAVSIWLLLLTAVCSFQGLPSKIDGYKVQNAKVIVTAGAILSNNNADVVVRLNDPQISKLGLLGGATVNISGDLLSTDRSGEIERIRFHDVRVNGVPVEVAEIEDGFEFKAGRVKAFTHTAIVTIGAIDMALSAVKELTNRRGEWDVTGTAFVFCKFKRFGFTFKRVIPVRVDLSVRNPLL